MVDSIAPLPWVRTTWKQAVGGALPMWRLRNPPALPTLWQKTPWSHELVGPASPSLRVSDGCLQASKARARRQARAGGGPRVLSPWASAVLKTPKTHPSQTQREPQAARALGRRQPQRLVQRRGEGRRGKRRVRASLSALPVLSTSSLRTDHILLLCGQRRPGAGEGGRAWTNQWGEKGGARGNVLVARGSSAAQPCPRWPGQGVDPPSSPRLDEGAACICH